MSEIENIELSMGSSWVIDCTDTSIKHVPDFHVVTTDCGEPIAYVRLCFEEAAKLIQHAPAMKEEIIQLRDRNAKLDRFARLLMKTIEEIEECSVVPYHISDSIQDILADWSAKK